MFPFCADRIQPLSYVFQSSDANLLDYGSNLAAQNADIVIFGDSASLFGIDAVRLSEELHQKVINIPETAPTVKNLGDWALKRYLASNRPPRLIIFYFTPWDLNFQNNGAERPWQGDVQIVRHGTAGELLTFTEKHPGEIAIFPFRFYAVANRATHRLMGQSFREFQVRQGSVLNPDTTAISPDCSFPTKILEHIHVGSESVQFLVRKYLSDRTPGFVYLAPIPRCKNVQTLLSKGFPGVDAAPPVLLPPHDFGADGEFIHPLATANATTTDLLRDAVRAFQNQSSASGSTSTTPGLHR